MIILIIFAVVPIVYLYFSDQTKKEKALKEKQELEQKKLREQRAEIERKRQIEEALKQKELKEKQEVEQKRHNEQRAEIERKKQIEEALKQNKLKENLFRENEQKYKQQFQNKFIIYRNEYLAKDISAFYHSDYHSGGNWRIEGTIENMIWTLKNDSSPFPFRLPRARQQFEKILTTDLPQILNSSNYHNLTVCVVPRAKKDSFYRNDQLYFRQIINDVVNKLNGFNNGVDYIKRHTNTKTTHLRGEEGGDGRLPYVGITKNTCNISKLVQNKDILLIDDIYTKTVNIDEDAIQALFDNGAKSVIFYAIGKTVSRF